MADRQKGIQHTPTVLIVLDGWGVALPSRANAITQARTPFFDSLISTYPTTTLQASGEATGLPWGEVGNSEVGHTNIGAGRIVYQELSRINASIRNGKFSKNKVIEKVCSTVLRNKSTLHLVGLISPGGVHSHSDHLLALLEYAKEKKVERVLIHAILDGRDTPYASGKQFIERVQEQLTDTQWRIASLLGRRYAMDRDNHWERTEKAYRLIAEGAGEHFSTDVMQAMRDSYEQGIYDEEFIPTAIAGTDGGAQNIHDGDAVFFFNIRADRMRQLVAAFANESFDKFNRNPVHKIKIASMTEYDKTFGIDIAFEQQTIAHSLAELLCEQNKKQLHIAETEKYAHITYFLNGGREEPYAGEKRIMIPSPSVESYDKKPQMSAREITEQVIQSVNGNEYELIAINFANADMVGHTGDMNATIKAIETLDECFSRIVPAVLQKNGAIVITADHGNAEQMLDLQTGRIDKEHTNNPVPCIIIAKELEGKSLGPIDSIGKDLSIIKPEGLLSDIAPTILELMNIQKPSDMDGRSLLEFS
ncbi:2,3-bisphosphoglycerate-independent phosphoglycerate mutase [Candidatus Uhrbacteria bacterium]|nr:2,3-bisphosphoglycerate-independent phosphoglycerate mutase [Candidatus Uhrbacteria bacterium]